MGLLANLFKSRTAESHSPVETAAPVPAPRPSLPARPRHGAGQLSPPSAFPIPDFEVRLTLGDIFCRIPAHFIRPGYHDKNLPLQFHVRDLFAQIARGRATVPLSRIALQCPEVFRAQITRIDDIEIQLPLQKVVEQIGSFPTRTERPPAPESEEIGTDRYNPALLAREARAQAAEETPVTEPAPIEEPPVADELAQTFEPLPEESPAAAFESTPEEQPAEEPAEIDFSAAIDFPTPELAVDLPPPSLEEEIEFPTEIPVTVPFPEIAAFEVAEEPEAPDLPGELPAAAETGEPAPTVDEEELPPVLLHPDVPEEPALPARETAAPPAEEEEELFSPPPPVLLETIAESPASVILRDPHPGTAAVENGPAGEAATALLDPADIPSAAPAHISLSLTTDIQTLTETPLILQENLAGEENAATLPEIVENEPPPEAPAVSDEIPLPEESEPSAEPAGETIHPPIAHPPLQSPVLVGSEHPRVPTILAGHASTSAEAAPLSEAHVTPPLPFLGVRPPALAPAADSPSQDWKKLETSSVSPRPFDQNRLQEIFGRAETFDPWEVARTIRALPEMRGCILILNDEEFESGDLPEELTAAAVRRFREIIMTAAELCPHRRNLTLRGEETALTLWTRPEITLAAVHSLSDLSPESHRQIEAALDALAE